MDTNTLIILLVIFIVAVLLIWWFVFRKQDEQEAPAKEINRGMLTKAEQSTHAPEPVKAAEPPAVVKAAPEPAPVQALEPAVSVAEVVAQKPDDLTIIEGIGPKIKQLLCDAGITTFVQLAAATPEQLRQILDKANLHISDPATWPEQAKLAAAGDFAALKTLQDALKGGRKVN